MTESIQSVRGRIPETEEDVPGGERDCSHESFTSSSRRWLTCGILISSLILVFQNDTLLLSLVRQWLAWPALSEFSRSVKALAEWPVIFGVPAVILCLDRRRRERAFRLLLILAIVGLSVQTSKYLIGRARPTASFNRTQFRGPAAGGEGSGYESFPSGHSASAFALAGAVAFWYPPLRVPTLILASAVGVSRVYQREHFPSDVYAGALLGYLLTRALLGSVRLRRLSESLARKLRLAAPQPPEGSS